MGLIKLTLVGIHGTLSSHSLKDHFALVRKITSSYAANTLISFLHYDHITQLL